MTRLFFLILLAFAAWYGWKHYHELMDRRPSDDAVVVNHSGHEMTRVRLTVGGQTFVKESIPDGASADFPFRVDRDSDFQLDWQWGDLIGEKHWTGGMVPRGPMLQRHTFEIDGEGAVLYNAENKL